MPIELSPRQVSDVKKEVKRLKNAIDLTQQNIQKDREKGMLERYLKNEMEHIERMCQEIEHLESMTFYSQMHYQFAMRNY